MGKSVCTATVLLWMCVAAGGQQSPTVSPAKGPGGLTAQALYLQLSSVGLDHSRVYRIRDAAFNRAAFHITLDDGTIAFTEDVAGHVTGAVFEGDGEVLLVPPNNVERSSMALFTKSAILEERFVTAFFRFNDETFSELQPFLRDAKNADDFLAQWNSGQKRFAEGDALRLLLTFSRLLPLASGAAAPADTQFVADDHFLHARMQGRKLGVFDIYNDSQAPEQVWAGGLEVMEGISFFNVWTSFSLTPREKTQNAVDAITGEEGKPGFVEITTFKIRSEVKPPNALSSTADLRLEVRQGGARAILFELSRFLQVKSVEADGHTVQFINNPALEGTQLARRGNDTVAVIFPEPLRTGQQINLKFTYNGDVLSEAGGGLLYVGARGTWYPNRGLAMSSFDLEFKYPAAWTLVATGKHVATSGEMTSSPTEKIERWISERPIPLAGFNLGKYSRTTTRAGDVLVETYAAAGVERAFPKPPPSQEHEPGGSRFPEIGAHDAPPTPSQNAQVVGEHAAAAIDVFARDFGPYPYASLSLTQMPGPVSQGWPGLIFLSSWAFLNNTEKSALHMDEIDRVLSDQVVVHETAHEWWGDLVGWSTYRDQWWVEALANYSSLMLLEKEDPAKFRAVMDRLRENLFAKNKDGEPLMDAGPVTLGSRLFSSKFPAGYEAISYGRGTWLFHMLRHMMLDAEKQAGSKPKGTADEPFIRGLKVMRERYQGKSISTRDLLRSFEEQLPRSVWYEGKKSLDWFYEGWVNGTCIPKLELQNLKYLDKAGTTVLSGVIVQKSASKELVTSVPIYAVKSGKPTFAGRVFADGPEFPFHLNLPLGTRKVVVDPEGTILTRVH